MNLRLAVASAYVPGFVRRKRLRQLLRRSAEAFGARAPDITRKSYRSGLRTFAVFTAQQAEMAYWGGGGERAQPGSRGAGDRGERAGGGAGGGSRRGADGVTSVRARLRTVGAELGEEIGRTLGIRGHAEVMRAAHIVYRMLGIDFEGGADGRIVVRRCGFSGVYSPPVCALVSGLDEGLLAGLAQAAGAKGGHLDFTSRITEGFDRCAATFHFEDEQP